MRARYCLVLAAALAITGTAWAQATPADAVAEAVASSGAFPVGTAVLGITIDGENAVVDLSAEAIPSGDSQSDEMVKEITNALGEAFPNITGVEVTVAGKALWEYLPKASAGEATPAEPAAAPMMMMSFSMAAAPATHSSELAGKMVALHPSHGSYWDQSVGYWRRAMRTLCGPNPNPPRPAGWNPLIQSTYTPSNYYYWDLGFQWESFYEDDMSPETIRHLAKYLESSGAEVWVSRNLDKSAGNFNYAGYGYPNCSFPLPKWQTAAKYYLQDRGDVPASVWNTTDVSTQSDKDLRARSYYANYRMEQKFPGQDQSSQDVWGNCLSFSLHSNAAGTGQARGTETFWYTSRYPHLQAKSIEYCNALESKVINAIRAKYDGTWAEAMYPTGGVARPEFPAASGTYRGYDQDGGTTTRWQDRGVKTSNFGEIRECKMPAQLMELAFHDDWKFYPDHVFMLDQIFRTTVAWGIYEGMCTYFGVTPKPQLSATVISVDAPAVVGPNQAFDVTVTLQNNGQAWCWGNKFDAATKVYGPYTVWKLSAVDDSDPFTTVTKVAIGQNEIIYPGETVTFTLSMTSPATSGVYTTDWQMQKEGFAGGLFGDVASTTITVDADLPEISILSPSATDYPYGCVDVQFGATDSSGISSLTADVDGVAVASGDTLCNLGLGAHTLTVIAVDGVGNTATQTVAFNLVNTVGKSTAGGWIELAEKKATCGITCTYVEGETAPSGSVTFQDHDLGMTVKAVEMIAMGIRGNKATIYGTCTIDGQAGHWFRIELMDNGEPSTEDAFSITLDTGYKAGGKLGGGNITIH